MNNQTLNTLKSFDKTKYKYGFVTQIESERPKKGLNEDTIEYISSKKNEPKWMLEWRLKAYNKWLKMKEPKWANLKFPKIDYQDIYYFSAPKGFEKKPKDLSEVDPKLLETYNKLGIPLEEQKVLAGVAIDAVFDSVSVATTYKGELDKLGIIFCSISEAIQNHPELVKKYLGSVIPQGDHAFSALNSAVFTDGSFVYIPENVKCPMELSTIFELMMKKPDSLKELLLLQIKEAMLAI